MILIVLGTQKFQLNRLLEKMDELVADGTITQEVYAQIGYSDYIPQHYEFTQFMDKDLFEQKISECEILVAHSGVGTIISGLNHRKPVIVFPRLVKYNEHVDDHQLEIAQSFSEQNFVLTCDTADKLADMIDKASHHKFSEYKSQRETVVSTIRNFLEAL